MRKDFGTKSWFYPLPVLVIATYDEQGKADAMNAAWGGLYDADKVVLCLSAGHKDDQEHHGPQGLHRKLCRCGACDPCGLCGYGQRQR